MPPVWSQDKDKLLATGQRILEEASALVAEAEELRGQVAGTEEALHAAQERYLRLVADFDNFRKRTVRAGRKSLLCAMSWRV
jgi:molecular chaperone GrpE (heat shock protein)